MLTVADRLVVDGRRVHLVAALPDVAGVVARGADVALAVQRRGRLQGVDRTTSANSTRLQEVEHGARAFVDPAPWPTTPRRSSRGRSTSSPAAAASTASRRTTSPSKAHARRPRRAAEAAQFAVGVVRRAERDATLEARCDHPGRDVLDAPKSHAPMTAFLPLGERAQRFNHRCIIDLPRRRA